MARNPQEFTGERFALRLALTYAGLFTTLGVQLPFLPVWLSAKGLDARAVGFVLAVPMIVRVFAIPMTTGVADRRNALRAVIILASAVAVAGYGLLALVDGVAAIMAVYALASIAATPVTLLVDAYALRGLAQWGRAYGPVRLWGSAAFIVSSFGAGLMLDVIPARDLIWLIVAAMGLSAAAACGLAPLARGPATAATARPSARVLLRDRGFVLVIVAASMIQSSHAVYYGFSTIDWQRAGFDGASIGALWALGVLAEIALFAVSARFSPSVTATDLILAGAVAACVRWGAMALGPPAALLPVLQCLHALSFGATHLGTLNFIARSAPEGLGATAQGYFVVAFALTMAVAMSLSGLLYARYGALAYGAMAVAAVGGGLCMLAARRNMTSR